MAMEDLRPRNGTDGTTEKIVSLAQSGKQTPEGDHALVFRRVSHLAPAAGPILLNAKAATLRTAKRF
jgi:hypothetical protein